MRSKKLILWFAILLTACSHNDGPLVKMFITINMIVQIDWNMKLVEEENSLEVLLLAFAIMVVLVLGVI